MIALFTALLAPLFVDWTSHRAAFEREASRIIGQPVKVSGRASMRILPLPTVTFSDISVGQYEDGTPMMTAKSFSMDAELMPFLRGEVKIVDMRLDGPHALIKVNENGTIDWTKRKEALVDPGKVLLERMVVTGASFEIEGLAGGRRITGQAFDAQISAQTLAGPWRITADGEIDGVASQFAITTGRLQEEGSLRVALEGRRLDQPYRLALDGPVEVHDGIIGWKGGFTISPALTPEGKPDSAALPVLATGIFAATPDAVEAPEYRLEIGGRQDPYTITGKGFAQIREEIAFRIEADGRQIDLDRLPNSAGADGAAKPAGDIASRLAALRRIADAIPVPQVKGEIDFELPAIVAGDTVVREISALIKPDGNGWQVARLRSTLPGNTTLEASGRLGTGEEWGFTGKMLLASRQPTGFANWLSGKSDASLRRLKSAGLTADVVLTPDKTAFDNLELVLDGVTINGSLRREQKGTGAPSFVAVLEGEEIDLEDLRAMQALTGEEAGAGFGGHDLNLTLKTALLRASGLEASDVDMQLRVEKGTVSIDRLNLGDFYGARVESSGKLNDLLGKASGNLGLTIRAQDGSGLVELARQQIGESRFLDAFAVDPALSSNVDVTISVDARPQGDGAKAMISANGEIGGARFDLRDEFEGQPARWGEGRHGLTAKISHDAPDVLARQFSLPALPLAPDGPVTIDLDLSGKPLEKMEGLLTLGAPGADFSANGTLGFTQSVASAAPDLARPTYDAAITLGVRDADPWLFMFGQSLPGAGEGTPLSLSAQVAGTGESHALTALKGQVAGNAFSGELKLDTPPQARPKLAGRLDLDVLSLPVLAQFITGNGTLSTLDGSESEMEFQEPHFTAVDGEVALTAKTFETGFSEAAGQFSAQAAMLEGALSLSQISAGWLSGQFTGDMSLKNADGDVSANLQGTLAGFDTTLALTAGGYAPVLAGNADAGFSLDAHGRSLKGLVADLAGSGTIAVRSLALTGIRMGDIGEILPVTDAEGFEVNPAGVAPLAEKALSGGKLEIGDLAGTFTVSSGKATIRNMGADVPGGRVEGEASADLPSGETTAKLTLKLDPGKEALAGAEPAVTFNFQGVPGSMVRSADTAALEGYLALRAFELEQRRVEILQASVLEKQRLRREVIGANARAAIREQERQAEELRLKELQQRLEEERIAREEAEAKRKAAEEEAARIAAEEEAARKAAEEEAARKAAEEEAARKAAEEDAARQQILNEAVPKTNGSKAGITVQDLPKPPAEIAPRTKPKPSSDTLFDNLDQLFQ